ncbi:hypothetical protein GY45DRAFT_1264491, partial [Cubamyces sp. BRFM 1775]
CTAVGREQIWRLLRELWEPTGQAMYNPSWGSIMGAACVAFWTENGTRNSTTKKRWRTLAVESAYLIWKLRCERVISRNGLEFTEQEVRNRWYVTLDRRLSLERQVVALAPAKCRAKLARVLEAVWSPILNSSSDLPPNWVVNGGVLVGIKRGR